MSKLPDGQMIVTSAQYPAGYRAPGVIPAKPWEPISTDRQPFVLIKRLSNCDCIVQDPIWEARGQPMTDHELINALVKIKLDINVNNDKFLANNRALKEAAERIGDLRWALLRVGHVLTVPKHVPAIPEAWDVIDAALKSTGP
jgi:hypothetical protein